MALRRSGTESAIDIHDSESVGGGVAKRLPRPRRINTSPDLMNPSFAPGSIVSSSEQRTRLPGPGVPYEFEGGEPRFSYVARTIEVDKDRFQEYVRCSKGRRSSGLFTAFLQPRNENEDVQGTHSVPRRRRHRSVFGIRMISPYNQLAGIWSVLMHLVDATYTAFLVPIIIAFSWKFGTAHSTYNWSIYIELIAGTLFVIDFLLNFHIGFIARYDYKKKVVMDGKNVVWYYIVHGGAWIDFLSIIPFFFELGLIVSGKDAEQDIRLVILRLFRLLRMLRLTKRLYLMSFSGAVNPLFQSISPTLMYLGSVVYSGLVMVNFLGCLLYFVARMESGDDPNDENYLKGTWIGESKDGVLIDESPARQYVASIYWAVTTVTTVGYGDITPATWEEEIIMMLLMVTHIMFFGLLIGSMTELVKSSTKNARRAEQYKGKMATVGQWLKSRRIPHTMSKKVNAYYAEVWLRKNEFEEADILAELPLSVRSEIVFHMTEHLLSELAMFKDVDKQMQRQLAGRLEPIELPPGHELCQQGDPAESIFILEDGVLLVLFNEKEGERIHGPATCGEGSIVVDEIPEFSTRQTTFRSRTACHVWELRVKDLEPLFEAYPTLKRDLLDGYRQRLMNKFARDSSASVAGLEGRVEVELGADITGTEAVSFRNKLGQCKSYDGTFPLLVRETLRRSRTSKYPNASTPSTPIRVLEAQEEGEASWNGKSRLARVGASVENGLDLIVQGVCGDGVNGMVRFMREIKEAGRKGMIGIADFQALLNRFNMKPQMLWSLFSHLDEQELGKITAASFMDLIRDWHPSRKRVAFVSKVFKSLDVRDTEEIDVVDLMKSFKVEEHGDVLSGRKTKGGVLIDMLDSFEGHDVVGFVQFAGFHRDISLCVEDDEEFEKMLSDMWGLSSV